MTKRHCRNLFLTVLFASAAAGFLYAEPEIDRKLSISWSDGTLELTASTEIPLNTPNITSARLKTAELLDRKLPSVLTEALEALVFNSRFTVKEYLESSPEIFAGFEEHFYPADRKSSSLSLDMSSVNNIYRYNIYSDLMPVLVKRTKSAPVPSGLTYEPTAEFSGIVIYARDTLPLYGTRENAMLVPAMMPRIYDENMNLVASADMTEQQHLNSWGFCAYTNDTDEKAFEDRIGVYPFRTVAVGIFGKNRTDIILTETAATKLLYGSLNERLVKEGRILVICNY